MSAHSGFLYYFDLLGLDREAYRVHYQFDTVGSIPNSAPSYPQLSGSLSSQGHFFDNSGSGFFTGQSIAIQNATGVAADFWTHIFLFEKTGAGRGVLFDGMQSGSLYSGYSIGVNDNNRLYFESYDNNGPFSRTSNLILGKRNLVAVTKTNNLLSFYGSDFNNEQVISDSFSINGEFVIPSSKGVIGKGNGSFIDNTSFLGYLGDYVFLTEALSPVSIKALFSGLCSSYQSISGTVSGFSTLEITGYATGVTGVTGVTGYSTQVTGSGIDPFSTGDYLFYYGNTNLTGYITSGMLITPQTGLVWHYLTGDSSEIISFDEAFAKTLALDEISFIRKITTDDIATTNIFPFHSILNKEGGYNLVEGKFQLDDAYDDSQIQVYLNGVSQLYTGYSVTGNFYGSGVQLSGDYRIDGYLLDSTGFFRDDEVLIYDQISGQKRRIFVEHPFLSGQESLVPGTDLVFFNGILLVSGLDFDVAGNQFRWLTNQYSTTTGALSTFSIPSGVSSQTGLFFQSTPPLYRNNSQVFLNGQRQRIEENYLENSAFDLIGQSGIFDNTLNTIYNNQQDFFE